MITLTATALAAVKTAIARSAPAVGGLRIMVAGADLFGPRYSMCLEREAHAGDQVMEQGGITLFIADGVQVLAGALHIDFVSASGAAAFVCDASGATGGGRRWN